MTPDRRIILAIFALAFGLRILYAVAGSGDPELGLLAPTYEYRTAVHIHSSLAWLAQPFSPDAPGYILSLAAVFVALPDSVWSVLIFQAALGGVTAFLLYRIGEQRLGRGVGLLSAVWMALYVHHMHFTGILRRDVLVVLLWVWLVRVLCRRFHEARSAVWAGLVFAALIHVEPMFMFLFPVAIVALLLFATHRRFLNLQYAIMFFVVALLASTPWMMRNYVVYHEPVPIALEAARYLRHTTTISGEVGEAVPAAVRKPGPLHNAAEFWRVVRTKDAPADPIHGITPEPAWSFRHNAVNVALFGLLLPFAAAGVWIAVRRRNRPAIAIAVALVAYFLLRVALGADERSRLPAEPLVILLAFYGVSQLVTRARGGGEVVGAESDAPAPGGAPEAAR